MPVLLPNLKAVQAQEAVPWAMASILLCIYYRDALHASEALALSLVTIIITYQQSAYAEGLAQFHGGSTGVGLKFMSSH